MGAVSSLPEPPSSASRHLFPCPLGYDLGRSPLGLSPGIALSSRELPHARLCPYFSDRLHLITGPVRGTNLVTARVHEPERPSQSQSPPASQLRPWRPFLPLPILWPSHPGRSWVRGDLRMDFGGPGSWREGPGNVTERQSGPWGKGRDQAGKLGVCLRLTKCQWF